MMLQVPCVSRDFKSIARPPGSVRRFNRANSCDMLTTQHQELSGPDKP